MYVFCVDVRTNTDYFPMQNELTGFYNRDLPFKAQWLLYVPPDSHSAIPRSAHTLYLCVLCGSQNKQRLFPYTALTDWFL
jgi:hypothetical protein